MSTIKFKNKYRIPSARWVDWDYGDEGAYFVTICTKNRLHYFGEIENAEMHYSTIGEIAAQEWLKSMQLRPDMELDMECFQVMPNHIHGIVVIGRDCRDQCMVETQCIVSLPTTSTTNSVHKRKIWHQSYVVLNRPLQFRHEN